MKRRLCGSGLFHYFMGFRMIFVRDKCCHKGSIVAAEDATEVLQSLYSAHQISITNRNDLYIFISFWSLIHIPRNSRGFSFFNILTGKEDPINGNDDYSKERQFSISVHIKSMARARTPSACLQIHDFRHAHSSWSPLLHPKKLGFFHETSPAPPLSPSFKYVV